MAPLVEALRRRLPGYDMHRDGFAPVPCAPLETETLQAVQGRLGIALPATLVEVWTQVGNGGFGPGYGLLGLGPGGFRDDLGRTADQVYEALRTRSDRPPHFRWPAGMFPICHLGCGILHCVDLASEEMVIWEPNRWSGRHGFATALYPTGRRLARWFEAWATGDTPSGWLEKNPTTGVPLLAPLQARRSPPPQRARKPDPGQLNLF